MKDNCPPYNYRKLDFRLPDFSRYAWVSDQSRAIWEVRIKQIVSSLQELEWRSVVENMRHCCLKTVHLDQMSSLAETLKPFNLKIKSLQKLSVSKNYSNSFLTNNDSNPFTDWSVIGRAENVEMFELAYRENDQETIGELLGYPQCCIHFFSEVWTDQGGIDTTWQMAYKTISKHHITSCEIEIPQISKNNILLRWLGVSAVFHLPCNFDCKASQDIAGRILELAKQHNFQEETSWITEMLRWPVEWSALHGIAEIKSPIVKVSTRTDATPETYRVRYIGDTYPNEGVQGLSFPYKQPVKKVISESNQYKAGIENPIQILRKNYEGIVKNRE